MEGNIVDALGDKVGPGEGALVGLVVSCNDGTALGNADGIADGSADGFALGTKVGKAVD